MTNYIRAMKKTVKKEKIMKKKNLARKMDAVGNSIVLFETDMKNLWNS